MKIEQILERAGINKTGRGVAYIKDGLEEIELHTKENVVRGDLARADSTDIATTAWGIQSANNYITHPIIGDQSLITSQLNPVIEAHGSFSGASGTTPGGDLVQYDYGSADAMTYSIETGSEFKHLAGSGGWSGVILPLEDLTVGRHYTLHLDWTVGSGDTAWSWISTENSAIYVPYKTEDGATVRNTNNTTLRALSSHGTPSQTIGNKPVDASGTDYYDIIINTDSSGYTDHYFDFEATATTHYLYIINVTSGHYYQIDTLKVYPTIWQLTSTSALFSNFKAGMKVFIDGSTYNDSDINANTTTGSYTALGPSSDGTKLFLEFENTLDRAQAASDRIIVRGQSQNYMDLIKDKRFYRLPQDMLRLEDVKIINHRNGNDKYRSVPRMVYPPLEQDGDNV